MTVPHVYMEDKRVDKHTTKTKAAITGCHQQTTIIQVMLLPQNPFPFIRMAIALWLWMASQPLATN